MPTANYQYFEGNRPWLNIYGTRVRPIQPVGSSSSKLVTDNCLLHLTLPEELLYEVFSRMAPYTLGLASCVCRKWRYAIRSPILWRNACLRAWQVTSVEDNEAILFKSYGGSWSRMWLQRPRLRFDGLFVSRNTYVRAGIAEWKIMNPVHLVCYFRYIRFYSNGKFLYKNSSLKLREVAKVMDGRPSKISSVFGGRYTLTNDQVQAAIVYPGLRPTILRFRLRVRGTTPGANNRLDLLSLVTSGTNGTQADMYDEVFDAADELQGGEAQNDVPAVSHRRGLAPFVFVPWEEVETSVLNSPVETMDYYVPG